MKVYKSLDAKITSSDVAHKIDNKSKTLENILNETKGLKSGGFRGVNGVIINYGNYITIGNLLIFVLSAKANRTIGQYDTFAYFDKSLKGNMYVSAEQSNYNNNYISGSDGGISVYTAGGLQAGNTITFKIITYIQ